MRTHVPGRRPVAARTSGGAQSATPAPAPSPVRPGGPAVAVLLDLQRRAGNAAAARMLGRGTRRSGALDVLRGPGRPLPVPLKEEMEARFGADFSDVRLHTGTAARCSAAGLGARAYTAGNHVVVGEGVLDRHTLAHELVHVLQQRSGPVTGTDRGDGTRVSAPGDRFERAAEDGARRALSGRPQPGAAAAPAPTGDAQQTPTIQRMRFYRGTSDADADALVARRGSGGPSVHEGRLQPTGSGEFGKGVYFWEEDRDAALVTALRYQAPDRAWAVVEYDVPDELVSRTAKEDRAAGKDWLSFPHDAETRPSKDAFVAMQTEVPRPYEEFTAEDLAQGRHPHPLVRHPVEGGAWATKKDGTVVTSAPMNVKQFYDINSDPKKHGEKFGLADQPADNIEWTNHPVVTGMSAADYSPGAPRQARFLGSGIDMLNHGRNITITKVLHGVQVKNRADVAWVRGLEMKHRATAERDARAKKLLS
ncbi:DUF4157 domain-containing protein [Streptoverticillium reticulum]|uniref:eCIS core domain-containing protein n=1 Tax=Streptoverticillium reticulum TaxID=1433415 RepID=UPI0039BED448